MAKKLITIAFAVLLTASAFAADSTQVKKFTRWYAGVSFTPGVSYRWLAHNFYEEESSPGLTEEQIQKIIISSRNKQEKPGFALALGFKAGFRATKFLSIETGLNYSRVGYWSKIENLTFGSYWNGNGYDTVSSNYYVKYFDHYHYVSIPIALHFNFGKGKLQAVINGGVNLDLLIIKTNSSRSNVPGFTNRTEQKDRYAFNRFNVSPFLGVGIDYHINEMMVLRIMPIAQMQALKNIDTPITEYLYSGGVNMSLQFNLQKKK